MSTVCVGLGFCGWSKDGKQLHVDDFIPETGLVTADQFVEWVYLADYKDPACGDESLKKAIKAAFIEHMGSDVVDARSLQWDCVRDIGP